MKVSPAGTLSTQGGHHTHASGSKHRELHQEEVAADFSSLSTEWQRGQRAARQLTGIWVWLKGEIASFKMSLGCHEEVLSDFVGNFAKSEWEKRQLKQTRRKYILSCSVMPHSVDVLSIQRWLLEVLTLSQPWNWLITYLVIYIKCNSWVLPLGCSPCLTKTQQTKRIILWLVEVSGNVAWGGLGDWIKDFTQACGLLLYTSVKTRTLRCWQTLTIRGTALK